MDVANKVVLVTGAASGLGSSTCQVLVAAGAKVVAMDRDEERLSMFTLGEDMVPLAIDVTQESSVQRGIDAARKQFGAIHVIVNCAGIANAAKTVSRGEPFPLAIWEKVIAVNLTGTFNMIRLGALAMADNEPDPVTGERGVIVNTSSGAATQGQVGQAAYSASKAGIMGLTLPVARDLAQFGIRVVSVAPGLFDTRMVAALPPEVMQSMIARMSLFPSRMGQPEEFGRLVQHIIENAFLNGTTIDLDGGARMAAR